MEILLQDGEKFTVIWISSHESDQEDGEFVACMTANGEKTRENFEAFFESYSNRKSVLYDNIGRMIAVRGEVGYSGWYIQWNRKELYNIKDSDVLISRDFLH